MESTESNGNTDDLVKLSFFVDIGKAVVRAKSISETLNEIMHQIGVIFSPLNWSILLKNAKTGDLVFTLVVGQNADKLRGQRLPKGEGVAGWIADTGQSLIIEDVTKDTRFSSRVDLLTGFRTESIIGVPLMTDRKVFGVIELINKLDGESFTPFELKVLGSIADFAAIAIEKAYYYQALNRLANTDPLTGVLNRRAFDRLYIREAEMCKRYGLTFSLLMVDIDNFKSINDTFGHPAGDQILVGIAELLQRCTRKVDTICRYGGDEFVVLMPNTPREAAGEARRRIDQQIEKRNSLNPKIPYEVSIGMHTVDSEDDSNAMVILDDDLYREKDKKLSRRFSDVEAHLADMLQDEMDTQE